MHGWRASVAPGAQPLARRKRCRAHGLRGEIIMGRSILLWLLGIPIPIIILLAIFWR